MLYVLWTNKDLLLLMKHTCPVSTRSLTANMRRWHTVGWLLTHPPSATLIQFSTNNVSTLRVCWVASELRPYLSSTLCTWYFQSSFVSTGESRSGRIFVIVVVNIQCSKLFEGMECIVLSMVLCTIKNPLKSSEIRVGNNPGFGLPSVAIVPECAESELEQYTYILPKFHYQTPPTLKNFEKWVWLWVTFMCMHLS